MEGKRISDSTLLSFLHRNLYTEIKELQSLLRNRSAEYPAESFPDRNHFAESQEYSFPHGNRISEYQE